MDRLIERFKRRLYTMQQSLHEQSDLLDEANVPPLRAAFLHEFGREPTFMDLMAGAAAIALQQAVTDTISPRKQDPVALFYLMHASYEKP